MIAEYRDARFAHAKRTESAVAVAEQEQTSTGIEPRGSQRCWREILTEEDIFAAVAVEVRDDCGKCRCELRQRR